MEGADICGRRDDAFELKRFLTEKLLRTEAKLFLGALSFTGGLDPGQYASFSGSATGAGSRPGWSRRTYMAGFSAMPWLVRIGGLVRRPRAARLTVSRLVIETGERRAALRDGREP